MKPKLITSSQWFKFNLLFTIEHFIGPKMASKLLSRFKKNLVSDIKQNKGIEQRGESLPLSQIEFTSFEEFTSKVKNPLESIALFRGAAKNWPATQKWSKDFFKENYGSTPISLIDNPGLVDPDQKNEFKKTNFAEYFKEVEIDKSKYLRFSRILDNKPELLKDLDLNWLRQFKNGINIGEQTFLFIGEDNTRTPMHAGLTHTIFIQVKGRKKWTIYAANERIFLDALPERYLYFRTHANPNITDDPNHPLLKYGQKYEFVLEQGDVLWMPSLFWHYIENLTPNIGVAYKYTNLPQSFKITKALTTLFFMATKPFILTSFIFNRKNKQDYVFSREAVK
jgi:hypothetical protein